MSSSRPRSPDPAPQFHVTCEACPGYATQPRYSRPTAFWEKDFHDSFIHGGEDHAEVEEVDRDA